jgi:hypothetical protein
MSISGFCRYYKRVYQDFFLSPDTFTNIVSRSLSGVRDGHHVSIHMQFGWLLFLALRMHVLQQFSDLVTCTNALLAVMVSAFFLPEMHYNSNSLVGKYILPTCAIIFFFFIRILFQIKSACLSLYLHAGRLAFIVLLFLTNTF